MTLRPINVQIGAAAQTPLPIVSTVIGIAGLRATGVGIAVDGVPAIGRTLTEIQELFGAASPIYDAAALIFSMAQVRIIGCAYTDVIIPASPPADRTAAIAALAAAQLAAIQGLRNSAQAAGRRPGVVLAPGLGLNATGAAEANATALAILAEQLKAIAILDAIPNAIALSTLWNRNNGKPRVLAIPQKITTPVKEIPGSSFLAGVLARNDSDFGPADSLSNRDIIGPVSTDPVYTFDYQDETTAAIVLREENLTTIVRDQDGTWLVIGGTMKTANATDPMRYVGVRRLADQISLAFVRIGRARWNRQQTADFMDGLIRECQGYLNGLVGLTIRSGLVAPDPILDTQTNRDRGLAYLSTSIDVPAINEQVNINTEISLVG